MCVGCHLRLGGSWLTLKWPIPEYAFQRSLVSISVSVSESSPPERVQLSSSQVGTPGCAN